MSRRNPRHDTWQRRLNAERLRAEGRPCWICREFGRPGVIDYSLPPGHPSAFEADDLCPVSRWQEGGYPSAAACAGDYANLDAAHRSCNQWRSNRSVAEVMAIARARHGGAPVQSSMPPVVTSRDWRARPSGR